MRITRAIKDQRYLKENAKVFDDFLTKKSVRTVIIFDNRTGKTYTSSRLRTKCSEIFLSYYQKWYKNGYKIIPEDLELTPLILATWIADDGCILIGRGRKNTNTASKTYPHRLNIKLATHGFDTDSLTRVKTVLENFTETKWAKYTDKSGTFLFLGRSTDAKKVIRLIDSAFPKSMNRKSKMWRNKEADLLEYKQIKPSCKWCNSTNVYKNGTNNQKKQKYLCKNCRRQYVK